METLAGRLKQVALGLGFDLVGVAEAGPARSAGALRRWLEAGRHGGMEYLGRTVDLRSDPRRLLPGCRSVVVVAMSYRTSLPPSSTAAEPGSVWISRYAWGRDYHRLLKQRLVRLGRWLAAEGATTGWRAAVDSAPLLEREWAATAGLGWVGKNSMLLNRRLGSELFLGVLLSEAPLPPDAPVASHCGRCTACLDACPTGALVAPGLLDARRCVAYLTVEHRGAIPHDLAAPMGDMVAGCDICQEVCPWNRRAPVDLHPELGPAPGRYRPLLERLEALDEEGWRRYRSGSPLQRISFEMLRRNLEVARGNAGS